MWSAPGTSRASRPAHAPPAQHAHPGANDSDDDEPASTDTSTAFQPTDIVNEVEENPTDTS